MAEKINLGEFNIDIESVVSDAVSTRKAIEEIKNEQKELVKQGKATDESFVRNAITLRGLSKDYNAQLKLIDQTINATQKQIPVQQRIDSLLAREAVTVEELRKQNAELIKTRNQVNISTDEGRKQLEALNTAIDKNNTSIKENVSEFEQQKMGIGSYADGIREALGETGLFDREIKTVQGTLKNFTPIFTTISTQLKGVSASFKTADTAGKMFSATLKLLRVALIATGIGAIVVALGSMVAYLKGSQEGVNMLNRALVPLRALFSTLLGVAQDLGKYLVKIFTDPKQVISDLIDAIKPMSTLLAGIATGNIKMIKQGFAEVKDQAKAVADAVSDVGDRLQENYKTEQQIQALNERIEESELNMERNQKRISRELMEQREIARDQSRSAEDREKAAKESIRLAEELKNMELGHLDLKLEKLKLEQSMTMNTHKDKMEMAALEAERDEIGKGHSELMMRLTSNLNNARKKGADESKKADDAAQKAAQERIKSMNEENDLIAAQQGIRAKSLDEQLAFEQQMSDRRKAIFDEELKAKLISQTEYDTRILTMQNELSKKQSEIVAQAAQRELAEMSNRIETERALSEAVGLVKIQEEERHNREIQEARARFEAIRFQEGLISEQEYQDSIAQINHDANLRQIELDKEFATLQRKAKQDELDLDLERELLAMEARNAAKWEVDAFMVEQERERRIEEARLRYEDEVLLAQAIANINAEAAYQQQQIEIAKNQSILQSRADLMGAIGQILGEETALGKAAAITQATINTYVGVTEALKLPFPLNIAAAATTLSTGLTTVGKVSGISDSLKKPQAPQGGQATAEQTIVTLNAIPPFATGGRVEGGIPINRSNGDNVLATLKVGEVVLNKAQQAALGGDAVFRSLGVPGFASGGLVGGASTATVQNSISKRMDTELAETIGKAVRDGSRQGTEVGSRQGIIDLSTERYIQNISEF